MEATRLLLQNLVHNGDITKSVLEKCLSAFHKKVNQLDKDLSAEFRKRIEEITQRLGVKNKVGEREIIL